MTIFMVTLFCGASEKFHLFEAPKEIVKIKRPRTKIQFDNEIICHVYIFEKSCNINILQSKEKKNKEKMNELLKLAA